MPSLAGDDGTDGLGTVPSVLQIVRTDGTVDNTGYNLPYGHIYNFSELG
jgi:hypothetical protein